MVCVYYSTILVENTSRSKVNVIMVNYSGIGRYRTHVAPPYRESKSEKTGLTVCEETPYRVDGENR